VTGHEKFNDEGRCGPGFQTKENPFYAALSDSLEGHRFSLCPRGFRVFTRKRQCRSTQSFQEAFARDFEAKCFSGVGLGVRRQKAFEPNHLRDLAARGSKDCPIL